MGFEMYFLEFPTLLMHQLISFCGSETSPLDQHVFFASKSLDPLELPRLQGAPYRFFFVRSHVQQLLCIEAESGISWVVTLGALLGFVNPQKEDLMCRRVKIKTRA